jgi:hypothetical protein
MGVVDKRFFYEYFFVYDILVTRNWNAVTPFYVFCLYHRTVQFSIFMVSAVQDNKLQENHDED